MIAYMELLTPDSITGKFEGRWTVPKPMNVSPQNRHAQALLRFIQESVHRMQSVLQGEQSSWSIYSGSKGEPIAAAVIMSSGQVIVLSVTSLNIIKKKSPFRDDWRSLCSIRAEITRMIRQHRKCTEWEGKTITASDVDNLVEIEFTQKDGSITQAWAIPVMKGNVPVVFKKYSGATIYICSRYKVKFVGDQEPRIHSFSRARLQQMTAHSPEPVSGHIHFDVDGLEEMLQLN